MRDYQKVKSKYGSIYKSCGSQIGIFFLGELPLLDSEVRLRHTSVPRYGPRPGRRLLRLQQGDQIVYKFS